MVCIKYIILISGKRKSGKDYLAKKLQKRLGERSQIIRISEPIKIEWSAKKHIDLQELLSDGPLKETYRKEMIEWSDELRRTDYAYFCKIAMISARKEIIIVSDIRRQMDMKYFKETFGDKVICLRVECSDTKRKERGWLYTKGIDDVESECGLDDYIYWDLIVENNEKHSSDQIIDTIINKCEFQLP